MRRTHASLRAALRDDPVYIAEQLGHRDARFTFSTYQKAVKRRERLDGERLAAFDQALAWAGVLADNWQTTAGELVSSPQATDPRIAGTAGGKLESGTARL